MYVLLFAYIMFILDIQQWIQDRVLKLTRQPNPYILLSGSIFNSPIKMELEQLPTDLLISIASLCDLHSIQQLSFVSKFFCERICRDDRLWKYLFEKLEISVQVTADQGGMNSPRTSSIVAAPTHDPHPWRSAVLKALGNITD